MTERPIESNALKANLAETAQEVELKAELRPLLEVVARYRGIHRTLEQLLLEICHPYRNWNLLLPQLRSFVLKNSGYYLKDEQGPAAFSLFTSLFLEALVDSLKNRTLMAQIIEAQLVWVEKMLAGFSPEQLLRFQGALNGYWAQVLDFGQEHPQVMLLIVQGQHPMKRVATRLLDFARDGAGKGFDYRPMAALMQAILRRNYGYWLTEDDPLPWFLERCGELCRDFKAGRLFGAISHETIRDHLEELEQVLPGSDPSALRRLLELPAHVDLVRLYREIPAQLAEAGREGEASTRFAENQKLLFLFRIMDTDGLYLIHEETLREINRSLVLLVRQQSFEEIEQFLLTAFQLLKANVRRYPHTSLQCI